MAWVTKLSSEMQTKAYEELGQEETWARLLAFDHMSLGKVSDGRTVGLSRTPLCFLPHPLLIR